MEQYFKMLKRKKEADAKKKNKCCKKPEKMPNRMEIMRCIPPEPPHPCDPPVPCDPCADDRGGCPKPILCLEKLKNPAYPGEVTKCKPGPWMNVQQCKRPPPPHPCDELECIPGYRKKVKCPPVALCYERIKNPEPKKYIKCPMKPQTYEAVEPKLVPCKPVKVICTPECPNIQPEEPPPPKGKKAK